MPVYKDKNGTWYVMTRCDDWQGQRKQKCRRGELLSERVYESVLLGGFPV